MLIARGFGSVVKHSTADPRIASSIPLPPTKILIVYVIILESPESRLGPISIRAISMHKIESREISYRKNISKQYWLAMNGKPKT